MIGSSPLAAQAFSRGSNGTSPPLLAWCPRKAPTSTLSCCHMLLLRNTVTVSIMPSPNTYRCYHLKLLIPRPQRQIPGCSIGFCDPCPPSATLDGNHDFIGYSSNFFLQNRSRSLFCPERFCNRSYPISILALPLIATTARGRRREWPGRTLRPWWVMEGVLAAVKVQGETASLRGQNTHFKVRDNPNIRSNGVNAGWAISAYEPDLLRI